MKNLNLFFLVIAVLAMVACGKKTDTAKITKNLEEQSDNWDKASNADDIDALALLYSEDALMMNPNVPELKGREAIRASFRMSHDNFVTVSDNKIVGYTVCGDQVVSRGTYTWDAKPKSGGNTQHDEGKWVCISKIQSNGSLKITLHIWNSDLPPVVPNQ